LKIPSAW